MLPAEAHRAPGALVVVARALALGATGLALLVVGCGDEEVDVGADSPGPTELTVSIDPDGPQGDPPATETVACHAEESDSACATLGPEDMASTPPATACTEIYGGPDEATLEGTIAGKPVDATFTRANGCEIDRFDRITPLLEELFPDYKPGASLTP